MYSDVVLEIPKKLFEEALDHAKETRGTKLDTGLAADDLRGARGDLQGDRREGVGLAVSAGRPRAALGGDRGGLPLLEQRAGEVLPEDEPDPRRLGDGGERAVDGLRQHGGRLRHRRRLHPRPVDRETRVFYGEFLPNAQGEDVVAGIRTPLPISKSPAAPGKSARGDDARGLRRAGRDLPAARDALPRHAGPRVHDPGGTRSTCSRPGAENGPASPR